MSLKEKGQGSIPRALEAVGGVVVAELVVPPRFHFPTELVAVIRLNKSRQARFEVRTMGEELTTVQEFIYNPVKKAWTGNRGDWDVIDRTDHPEEAGHQEVVDFYAKELRAKVKEGTA